MLDSATFFSFTPIISNKNVSFATTNETYMILALSDGLTIILLATCPFNRKNLEEYWAKH